MELTVASLTFTAQMLDMLIDTDITVEDIDLAFEPEIAKLLHAVIATAKLVKA